MIQIHLIHGDFRTVESLLKLKANFFSLVLIDPPYARQYLSLWESLALAAQRVLKLSGFFVSYSGNAFLNQVIASLDRSALNYYWMGGVQHQIAGQQSHWNVINCIKPLLIYNKPPKTCPPGTFVDLLAMGKMEKGCHSWQQSLDEARVLIRTFTKPGFGSTGQRNIVI